jgi:quinoprotein glucose dehydrogenase
LLKNPDMRVRMKAQFELVKRKEKGAAMFQQYLTQTANQLARVNSIWGISQLARQDKKYAAALLPFLQDKDAEIRAQAAKWLGDIKYAGAGKYLLPLLKDTASRARFFAAEALGRMVYEPAINAIVEMLSANNDKDAYLRHAGSLALARIGKADPIIALANNPSRGVRIAAVVALRRMGNAGIATFLNDADEFIVTEAARGINDDLSIEGAIPALAALLNTTTFKNEALIRRAISANSRLGTVASIQNLINYAAAANPPALKAEAIATLSNWARPSVVDRVDGRFRGVIQRDSMLVISKAGTALVTLLNSNDAAVRLSAIKAVSKLNLVQGASKLLLLLKHDNNASVKVEALKALAAMQHTTVAEAIQVALTSTGKQVRVAGIDMISKLNIPKPLMVKLLADVINTKTTEEKQAALLTLGNLPVSNTNEVFTGLLAQLSDKKLSPDIYFELGQAIDSTKSQPLIAKYKAAFAGSSADELTASFAGSLYGGDVAHGKNIFFQGQASQCIRCHSYDDLGGNAGPKLNGIASRLPRQKLLEALINPSARLSPGYGSVILQLKNGKTISGILEGETDKTLTVKISGEPNAVVSKNQVAKRTNALSSMPEMKNILSKKEIRDVVAFLATLK